MQSSAAFWKFGITVKIVMIGVLVIALCCSCIPFAPETPTPIIFAQTPFQQTTDAPTPTYTLALPPQVPTVTEVAVFSPTFTVTPSQQVTPPTLTPTQPLFGNSLIFHFIQTNSTLRVFDVQTGQQLKTFELKQVLRKSGCNISLPFVITADGSQIVSITENCRLGLFDLATRELKQEFGDPFKDSIIDLALSHDNRLLAVGYQNKLELWDLAAGKLLKWYANPALFIYPTYRDAELSYTYQVAFSPDGTLLGTRFGREYSYNSIITLWGMP